ncbi:MAG TPA: hypothetical protein VN541_08955 [Tepidisphaeraceae bacterium]|nr:hypothetical protein [Tepidisphaeraceae bacterium]
MPLSCNIDSRGKVARLLYGILMLLAAIALAVFWAYPEGGWWRWIIAIVIGVAGAFGIFEARAGWCVMRAMGFKTPM